MDFGASSVASALARAGFASPPDGVGRVDAYEDAYEGAYEGAYGGTRGGGGRVPARGPKNKGVWFAGDDELPLGRADEPGEFDDESDESVYYSDEDDLGVGKANAAALAAFDRADAPRGTPAARGALASRNLRVTPSGDEELLEFSELLEDAAAAIARLAGRAAPRAVYVGAYSPAASDAGDPRDKDEGARGGGISLENPFENPSIISLGDFLAVGGDAPASDASDGYGDDSDGDGDENDDKGFYGGYGGYDGDYEYRDEVRVEGGNAGYEGFESYDGYMASGGDEGSQAYEAWVAPPARQGGSAAPGSGWSILDYAT